MSKLEKAMLFMIIFNGFWMLEVDSDLLKTLAMIAMNAFGLAFIFLNNPKDKNNVN